MHEAIEKTAEFSRNLLDRFTGFLAHRKHQLGALAVAGLALYAPGVADSHQDNSRETLADTHPAYATMMYGSVDPISDPKPYVNPKNVNYRLPSLRWPIKPFLRSHAVRGTFGEPRAHITDLPPADERPHYLMHNLSNGARMIPRFNRRPHIGIDIPAPDNTPVYSMTGGRVSGITKNNEKVTVGYIDYVHINRLRVRNGQNVKPGRILGYIMPKEEHVHISMKSGGKYIDPLSYRRFAGYRDTRPPVIERVIALKPDGEEYEPGDSGKVELFVKGYDENNALETGGSRHRRTGVKSVSIVLQNAADNRIISKRTVAKFERLPHPDAYKMALNPLSQRIRPLNRFGRPDIADFYYRLTTNGQLTMPPNRTGEITRILTVGLQDSFGNRVTQQFGL